MGTDTVAGCSFPLHHQPPPCQRWARGGRPAAPNQMPPTLQVSPGSPPSSCGGCSGSVFGLFVLLCCFYNVPGRKDPSRDARRGNRLPARSQTCRQKTRTSCHGQRDGRASWQGGVLGWFIYAGLFRRSPRFPTEEAAASPAPGVPGGPAPGAARRAHLGGHTRGNGAGNGARAGAAELEQAEINSVCQEMAQTQPSGCFSRCSLSMHGSPCPGPALAAAPSTARRALGAAAPDGTEPWKPGRALQVSVTPTLLGFCAKS